MSKKSKMLAIGKVFVTCLLLVFTAINLNAQLVTNGGFESSEPGAVTGTDVEGWLIQISAGSAVFEIVMIRFSQATAKVTVDYLGSNHGITNSG